MWMQYASTLLLKFSIRYIHPNYLFYCFSCVCIVCPNLSSAPRIWRWKYLKTPFLHMKTYKFFACFSLPTCTPHTNLGNELCLNSCLEFATLKRGAISLYLWTRHSPWAYCTQYPSSDKCTKGQVLKDHKKHKWTLDKWKSSLDLPFIYVNSSLLHTESNVNFVGIWYEVTSSATPWAGSITWKRWTIQSLTFGKFKQSAILDHECKCFGQKTENSTERVYDRMRRKL